MLRFLLGAFLSALSMAGIAQYTVSGKLLDADQKFPVQGATVALLLQKDSTHISNTVTGAEGKFLFENIAPEKYFVKINSLSHQQYIFFATISSSNADLGELNLIKKGKDLAAVTVVSKGSPVVNRADTTQYAASQYKVNPDATTEDLIKKMPGISVAKDGTVTAQGETVRKVTIDGRDFFGDDASAALKNLPSEVVDKIQVFDRLSDQAQLTGVDDGNSVKAINVVTKTGIKNGQFGRAYAGMGTNERYQAGGNVSFFKGNRRVSLVANFNNINQQNFGSQDLLGVTSGSGRSGGMRGGGGGQMGGRGGFGGGESFMVGQSNGISRTNAFGINYSDKWGKKTTISGSYFFNNSKNVNEYDVLAQTLYQRLNKWYNDNSQGSTTTFNSNHRINLRAEIKLDSNNSIFIIPSISFQTNSANGYSNGQSFYAANDSLNSSVAVTDRNSNGYNIRNNIMYRYSFPKKGRTFSVGFNTSFTKNSTENILDAAYRFYRFGAGFDSLVNRFTDNLTNGSTIGGTIAYTEPVGKNAILQFEYNPSVQKNKADQQTFEEENGKYSLFNPLLSNKFDNRVRTHNAGVSYRYNPNRDNMLTFGVNYQNTNLESDRIYPSISSVSQPFSNFLPRLMWRRKISTTANFMMFYRAGVNFPSISQLQDVLSNSTPLRVSIGNPELKQAYSHYLMGRYSFASSKTGRSFFANIFAQTTTDYINNATYLLGSDTIIQNTKLAMGAQLTKPVNLDGYKNFRTLLTYTFPVKFVKSNLSINTGAAYSKLPGLSNSLPVNTNNYSYNAGLALASNISEYVDFNLSYNAAFNNVRTVLTDSVSKTNYANYTTGLQINLLSKKGWFIQNEVSNQTYTGLSEGLNQSYWLWNAGIGKKFLKNRKGELKLTVFDLLKENQSVVRTVTADNIEDARYNVLQQYFMLTFTYNLKNFGKGRPPGGANSDGRQMGGPPPGGGMF